MTTQVLTNKKHVPLRSLLLGAVVGGTAAVSVVLLALCLADTHASTAANLVRGSSILSGAFAALTTLALLMPYVDDPGPVATRLRWYFGLSEAVSGLTEAAKKELEGWKQRSPIVAISAAFYFMGSSIASAVTPDWRENVGVDPAPWFLGALFVTLAVLLLVAYRSSRRLAEANR